MTKILPEEFIQQTQELMGEEMFAQLADAICHSEPPTSIRLNQFKVPRGTHLADNSSTDAEAKVKAQNESGETAAKDTEEAPKTEKEEAAVKAAATSVVPWCPDYGRYLTERPNFTFDHSSMPVCIMHRKPLLCLSTSW